MRLLRHFCSPLDRHLAFRKAATEMDPLRQTPSERSCPEPLPAPAHVMGKICLGWRAGRRVKFVDPVRSVVGAGGPARSCRSGLIRPGTTAAIGTSLVLTPISAWAATTEVAASGPVRAASRRTWFPLAPLTALPSSLTCINPDLHQRPRAVLLAGIPAGRGRHGDSGEIHQPGAHRHVERLSVSIGQHPPDRGLRRRRGRSSTAAQVQIGQDRRGTSATQPVIAV